MKIYVAGKNLERAAKVMTNLRKAGHRITYDWVAVIDDIADLSRKAYDEREAIKACDALVYLWEDDKESARYEAGMVMGLDKKVIVNGKESAHFFALPGVTVVKSDDEILSALTHFRF